MGDEAPRGFSFLSSNYHQCHLPFFFHSFYLSFNRGHHFLLYVAPPVGSPKINLSGPQEVHICHLCNLYTKMQSCTGVLTPTGPVSVYSDVKKNISMGLYGFPGINKYVYDFIGLLYFLQCCFSTLRFMETAQVPL